MRTYRDSCGIARALDVVGDRWALLVVRELLLGPKRFSDLREGLPAVSTDMLSLRLRELQAAGIVRRAKLPPPARARVYELSERGRQLEPVLLELGRWGSAAPFPEGAPPLGADAMALALKTVFDPAAAEGLSATYELRLDGQPFVVRVEGGELDLARGEAERHDATIATDPATLSDVLWRGGKRSELEVGGSGPAVTRFLRLFRVSSSEA
ncbi:MAG TPA: helix-turn-helix domain-containing protein [Thermoleophilaceae bacterium]|jgi:DNA-binding HxlR family transcriptional regulator